MRNTSRGLLVVLAAALGVACTSEGAPVAETSPTFRDSLEAAGVELYEPVMTAREREARHCATLMSRENPDALIRALCEG